MKKLIQLQLFIILAVSLIFIGCSQDDTDFALVSTTLGDEFPGSITGKVLWKGSPLLGVSITSDLDGVSTVSGTDGSFILDNLTNGNHILTFFKAGYFDTTLIEPILVNLKTETKLATDVNMVSLYSTINGEVLNVNGSRLPFDQMAGIAIEGQSKSGVALGGEFTLGNVEAGTIKIRSVVSGLGFGETEVEILPDTVYNDIQIQLAGVGGKVSGTITEGDTKIPVSGATVSVIENVLETVTDKDGAFELDNVPSTGEVSLTVKKPGTAGTTDTVSVVIGGVTVEEEGEVNVGALDLTKDPADTSALFGIQNGFIQADFIDPTHKVTIFSPVYLKDTENYDLYAFQWDIDADGEWDGSSDMVTPLPKIVIGKQPGWITSGVKYPVLGRAVAVSKIDGKKVISPVGRVNIEIKVPNTPAKIDLSTAPVDIILTEGAPYSTNIKATDTDKDVITYKLVEFPEGMTIDGATGAISWSAATLGAHRVKVTATDGKGISAGHAWTITVPSPVTIDNVTGATTVAAGEPIVLSAVTTSLITPVYYIWEIKPASDSLFRIVGVDTVTTGTGKFTVATSAGLKENGATVRLTVDNGTNKQSQIWNLAVTGIVQTPFTNMLSATYWYSVTDETGSKATLSGLPTTLKWDVNILASTSSWGNVNSGPLTIDGTTKATYETAKSIRIVYRSTDEFSLSLPMPENEQYNWAGHDYLLRNTSGVWDSLEITIDTVNFKNLYGEPTAPFNKSHVTNMALNAYDTYPGVLGYIEVRRLELVGFTGTEFDEGGTVTSVIDSVSGSTTVVEGAALNLTAYANSSVKTPITYTWQLDGVTLKTTPSTTQYEDILNHTGLTVADNGKTLSLIVTNGIVTDTVKKVISVISGGTSSSVVLDNFEKNVLLKNTLIAEPDYTAQSTLGYQFGGFVDGTYDSLGWGGGYWYAFASDNGVVVQSEDQGDSSTVVVAGDGVSATPESMLRLFGDNYLSVVLDATNLTDATGYWAGVGVSLPGYAERSLDSNGVLWDGLNHISDAMFDGSPTERYCWNLENLESITIEGTMYLGDITLNIHGVNSVTKDAGAAVFPLAGGKGADTPVDISQTIYMSDFLPTVWNGQEWIDIKSNVYQISFELNTENSNKSIMQLNNIILNFKDEASKNSAFPFMAQ